MGIGWTLPIADAVDRAESRIEADQYRCLLVFIDLPG